MKEPRIKNFNEIEKEPRIKNFIHIEDPNAIIHEENRRVCSREVMGESTKEAGNNSESEKRKDERDTFKIQKKGIESKEKKFKDYDLTSKERVKVQQISSYNKQKLGSEEKSKFCITGKEKDGQNVSQISNQIKVSRVPRPIKKESDINNQQKSVKNGFNVAIQQQPGQRIDTIQNLSVPEDPVHPESVTQEEDQNVSAAADSGDQIYLFIYFYFYSQ